MSDSEPWSDVMLDLETMGLRAGSSVLSIGAIAFRLGDLEIDPSAPKFHVGIDLLDSLLAGLSIDVETLRWWTDQTPEAKRAILALPRVGLDQAIVDFARFLQSIGPNRLWVNGSDAFWLAEVYNRRGLKEPWSHRDVRDCRTLWEAAGISSATRTTPVLPHDALSDCEAQATDVMQACQRLWARAPRPVPPESTAK